MAKPPLCASHSVQSEAQATGVLHFSLFCNIRNVRQILDSLLTNTIIANFKEMKNLTIILLLITSNIGAQGLLNNNADFVINNTVNVVLNNSNYTSQAGGVIRSAGVGGSTLHVDGNWINNSANSAFFNDGVIVDMNGGNQSIGGTNSSVFDDLKLSGTGIKQLLLNTSVGGQSGSGVLSLGNRPIDLNGNRLTINNSSGAAVTYTNGLIQSETNVAVNPSVVRWQVANTLGMRIIPFGLISGMTQIPLSFQITTAMSGTASYVDFSTRATLANDNLPWAGASNVASVTNMFSPLINGNGSIPVVIDRWWDISPSQSLTANVTFRYRGIENTMAAPYINGNLGAQAWNGTAWQNQVGSVAAVTTGVGAVVANGLSQFCPFILSSATSNAALPIEMLKQEVECINNTNTIYWSTASEHNNDYFSIESSANAIDFLPIAKVYSYGNSTTIKNYKYVDVSKNGYNYYRIIQFDKDGSKKIFPIITKDACQNTHWVELRNNNSNAPIVYINSKNIDSYLICIYDCLGKLILKEQMQVEPGENFFNIKNINFSNSMYLLTISNNSYFYSNKLFIQ